MHTLTCLEDKLIIDGREIHLSRDETDISSLKIRYECHPTDKTDEDYALLIANQKKLKSENRELFGGCWLHDNFTLSIHPKEKGDYLVFLPHRGAPGDAPDYVVTKEEIEAYAPKYVGSVQLIPKLCGSTSGGAELRARDALLYSVGDEVNMLGRTGLVANLLKRRINAGRRIFEGPEGEVTIGLELLFTSDYRVSVIYNDGCFDHKITAGPKRT